MCDTGFQIDVFLAQQWRTEHPREAFRALLHQASEVAAKLGAGKRRDHPPAGAVDLPFVAHRADRPRAQNTVANAFEANLDRAY